MRCKCPSQDNEGSDTAFTIRGCSIKPMMMCTWHTPDRSLLPGGLSLSTSPTQHCSPPAGEKKRRSIGHVITRSGQPNTMALATHTTHCGAWSNTTMIAAAGTAIRNFVPIIQLAIRSSMNVCHNRHFFRCIRIPFHHCLCKKTCSELASMYTWEQSCR